MPGQTTAPQPQGRSPMLVPSMEGRAIARPNAAQPATKLDGFDGADAPSMEGRAIARPNDLRGGRRLTGHNGSFNGGPGNCPAKLPPYEPSLTRV